MILSNNFQICLAVFSTRGTIKLLNMEQKSIIIKLSNFAYTFLKNLTAVFAFLIVKTYPQLEILKSGKLNSIIM